MPSPNEDSSSPSGPQQDPHFFVDPQQGVDPQQPPTFTAATGLNHHPNSAEEKSSGQGSLDPSLPHTSRKQQSSTRKRFPATGTAASSPSSATGTAAGTADRGRDSPCTFVVDASTARAPAMPGGEGRSIKFGGGSGVGTTVGLEDLEDYIGSLERQLAKKEKAAEAYRETIELLDKKCARLTHTCDGLTAKAKEQEQIGAEMMTIEAQELKIKAQDGMLQSAKDLTIELRGRARVELGDGGRNNVTSGAPQHPRPRAPAARAPAPDTTKLPHREKRHYKRPLSQGTTPAVITQNEEPPPPVDVPFLFHFGAVFHSLIAVQLRKPEHSDLLHQLLGEPMRDVFAQKCQQILEQVLSLFLLSRSVQIRSADASVGHILGPWLRGVADLFQARQAVLYVARAPGELVARAATANAVFMAKASAAEEAWKQQKTLNLSKRCEKIWAPGEPILCVPVVNTKVAASGGNGSPPGTATAAPEREPFREGGNAASSADTTPATDVGRDPPGHRSSGAQKMVVPIGCLELVGRRLPAREGGALHVATTGGEDFTQREQAAAEAIAGLLAAATVVGVGSGSKRKEKQPGVSAAEVAAQGAAPVPVVQRGGTTAPTKTAATDDKDKAPDNIKAPVEAASLDEKELRAEREKFRQEALRVLDECAAQEETLRKFDQDAARAKYETVLPALGSDSVGGGHNTSAKSKPKEKLCGLF